jgi:hypothetical protein
MSAVRTSTLSATLELGVVKRVLMRVVGLVGPPDVDAGRQQFGGCEQNRTAPAAQVEQRFVAAQPQAIKDLGPHLELADARGADEQRRRRRYRRADAAANHRGDGLASRKTSGRRRKKRCTRGSDNGRNRRRGHRAVVPVVPVVGPVVAKIYDGHSSKVRRRDRPWGATYLAFRGTELAAERHVDDLLLLDGVHLRRARRRRRHRPARNPFDARQLV